ncbi:MAG TPA: ATP-binding cassette domain-containing protein, partial [bacterium]|nr:ATP-binding cassette domain-containing protein [bacterium]
DEDTRPPAPAQPTARAEAIAPDLVIQEVSFYYGASPVLSGLSLRVAAGEHVALCGPSGSGKSTLISLLLRFARPQAGAILVDGRPLADLGLAEWHRRIAWLPQRPTLFHGTVRQNLLLGRSGDHDSDADLRRALERARLPDLPLDTPVGEAGQGLSTGQVQRVALARLFLRNPHVVLLDEPTAHLDAENAALVSESILELARGRTTILVTHRPQTAAGMDRLVTLPGGRPA